MPPGMGAWQPERLRYSAATKNQWQRKHLGGWVGSWVLFGRVGVGGRGLGLFGWQNTRGDEEGFAVGPIERRLSGDVSGGRWLRPGSANGFVCFGLGLQNGFVR